MINMKIGAVIAAAFIAGAFVASPELRAFAANTVFSGDIVDGEVKTADLGSNSVTAAKIKDGEVRVAEIASNAVGSSEIATDAVGAAEIQGVTKLLFGQCKLTSSEYTDSVPAGSLLQVDCNINGVDSDDSAFATRNYGSTCFEVVQADPMTDNVRVFLRNDCISENTVGSGSSLSILVYDK
jgi:hypothetical protein